LGKRGEFWVVAQAAILALIVFAPMIGEAWPLPALFQIPGWLLIAIGVPLSLWSAMNLGRSLTPFPRPLPDGRLVSEGAYRFVRHPIYLGVLLCSFGYALATLSPLRLALSVVLFIFFDMKSRREEKWLAQQYPEYVAYKTRVRKLLPWIY
jgi:protein-S-isoprenylcysteine O-methyltransferase Ste14